ncbi:MAG: Hsp20/alpha crystallin family protein [bacterium]|jgi:HSP20 family molecular chaperone IbpA|nr:Hsp20/alpha crystallin family protein [bacterium]
MAEKTTPVVQESHAVSSKEGTRSDQRFYYPAVDIYEQEDKLVVVADLPGAEKDTVQIKVEAGTLTVQASPQIAQMGDTIYREFEWGQFYRQFEISDEINVERIDAVMKNGVLTLTLPKMQKLEKRIEVKVQ